MSKITFIEKWDFIRHEIFYTDIFNNVYKFVDFLRFNICIKYISKIQFWIMNIKVEPVVQMLLMWRQWAWSELVWWPSCKCGFWHFHVRESSLWNWKQGCQCMLDVNRCSCEYQVDVYETLGLKVCEYRIKNMTDF